MLPESGQLVGFSYRLPSKSYARFRLPQHLAKSTTLRPTFAVESNSPTAFITSSSIPLLPTRFTPTSISSQTPTVVQLRPKPRPRPRSRPRLTFGPKPTISPTAQTNVPGKTLSRLPPIIPQTKIPKTQEILMTEANITLPKGHPVKPQSPKSPPPEIPPPKLPTLRLSPPKRPRPEIYLPKLPRPEIPPPKLLPTKPPLPEPALPELPHPEVPPTKPALPEPALPSLLHPEVSTKKPPLPEPALPELPHPEVPPTKPPLPELPLPELPALEHPPPKLAPPKLPPPELPPPKLPPPELPPLPPLLPRLPQEPDPQPPPPSPPFIPPPINGGVFEFHPLLPLLPNSTSSSPPKNDTIDLTNFDFSKLNLFTKGRDGEGVQANSIETDLITFVAVPSQSRRKRFRSKGRKRSRRKIVLKKIKRIVTPSPASTTMKGIKSMSSGQLVTKSKKPTIRLKTKYNKLAKFFKCRPRIFGKNSSKNGLTRRNFSSYGKCLLREYPQTKKLSLGRGADVSSETLFESDSECTGYVHEIFPECKSLIHSCKETKKGGNRVGALVLGCLFTHYSDILIPLVSTTSAP